MKKQRILAAALAGLCAVSTMGVSAFAANEEKVETSGAKTYKISAGFQAPTIDVTVPETFEGVINPYKVAVTLDTGAVVSEGIASPRYPITNNSAEVGINIKATYSAEGLDGVVADPDDAIANNTDKKKLAYVTLNSVATQGADDDATTTLVMASTENATPDLLLTLEESATGKANKGEIWIGGDVIEDPAEKWTTSDKLAINVVLDINPYNPNGGSQNPSTTARVTGATATVQGTPVASAAITVDSANKTITITSGASAGNTVAVTLATDTGMTLGTVTATDGSKLASPTLSGSVVSGTFIAAGGGFTILVNNGTDDETWTVTVN